MVSAFSFIQSLALHDERDATDLQQLCILPIPKGLVGYRNELEVGPYWDGKWRIKIVRLAGGAGRENCKRRGELRAGGRAA